MLIDFNQIEEQTFPRFKGGEKEFHARMFFDGSNRIMKGRLIPGASIGLHTHDTSCEMIFVSEGHGTVIYDGEHIALHAGDCHYCPQGHAHTLINDSDSDLLFTAVVPQQ